MFQSIKFALNDFYLKIVILENKMIPQKKALAVINHALLILNLILISILIYNLDWYRELSTGIYFTFIIGGYFSLATNKKFFNFWNRSSFLWVLLLILMIILLIYLIWNYLNTDPLNSPELPY